MKTFLLKIAGSEGLEVNFIKKEGWKKMPPGCKSNDLKLQKLRDLVLKSLTRVSNLAENLYNSKKLTAPVKLGEFFKRSIKQCADDAKFLGKVNYDNCERGPP